MTRVLSVAHWMDDGTPVWNRPTEPGELERLARHETSAMQRDVVELHALASKQIVARDRQQLENQARHLEERVEAIRAARLALDQQERQRLEDHDDAMKRLAQPDIEAAQDRFRRMKALA